MRPSSRRLLELLSTMTAAQRAQVTNVELAGYLGTSTRHPRTVTLALRQLQQAGFIAVERHRPHPVAHPTGRAILLTGDIAPDQEVGR